MGFGPELVGFNDRHGTRWKISAIPLGGYVKFFGDDSEASTPSAEALASMTDEERAGSFHHKKVGPRAAIVAAGPIANFILAIVIFAGLFTFFGKPSTTARVDKVEAGQRGGSSRLPGRRRRDRDRRQQRSRASPTCSGLSASAPARQLTFTVKRGDSILQLQGTPQLKEVKDPFGNVHRLACWESPAQTSPGDVATERVDPATALWLGVKETWFVVDRTLSYIGGVFTGREAADQVGGPLRIAQISGQVATIGLAALIHLAAVLSISIGLLNLFPVPLLDGGHLLFYAVEAVRGTPAVGAGAGDGVPNRAGFGADVDGVCHL